MNSKFFLFLSILLLISFTSAYQIQMNQTINLSEMSLDEKIGQLMLIRPTDLNKVYLDELHVGGIFLSKQKTKEENNPKEKHQG